MKSRQLEILLYLMEVKKTTYAKLSLQFEVSKRTIIRDIDSLSAMGIPIYTQSGYEGGIFISPDYRFNNSFFTKSEIEDIILAFHVVKHLNREVQEKRKNSVLKKLELLVPELAFLKEFDFDEYLKIDLIEKPVTTCTPVCKIINEALDDEVFVDMIVNNKHFTVAPLYYILQKKGLYLYCVDDNDYFSFPIDDIAKCSKTEKVFHRDKYQSVIKNK